MGKPKLRLPNASWGSRRPGRGRRWLGAIAFFGTLVGALFLGTNDGRLHPGTYSEPSPVGGLGGACLVIGLLSGVVWALAGSSGLEIEPTPEAQGVVRVKGGRLTLHGDEKEIIPLADVESGWLGPACAVLRLRGGREVSIFTQSPEDAEALLAAAGVAKRVTRLPIGGELSRVRGGGLVGCSVLFFGLIFAAVSLGTLGAGIVSFARGLMAAGELAQRMTACLLPLVVLAAVMRFRAPRTAEVGADGVAIEGLFGRRFLPYAEIASVTGDEGGIVIRRKRGLFKRVALELAPGGESLQARLEKAMRVFAAGGAAGDLERLDRGGRAIADWVADLKGLHSSGDYRRGALLPERLAEVVEDPAATPERRVAAAVAIAASGDHGARKRVRIAAEASADVELRAALEEAAQGEVAGETLERASRRVRG